MAGRPTKGTPDAQAVFLKAVADGNTLKTACWLAGFSEDSLARQRADNADFADAIKKAQGAAIAERVSTIKAAGDSAWTACAWWLERRFPEEWAKREEVAPSGPDFPDTIPADSLTDEQLDLVNRFWATFAESDGNGAGPAPAKLPPVRRAR